MRECVKSVSDSDAAVTDCDRANVDIKNDRLIIRLRFPINTDGQAPDFTNWRAWLSPMPTSLADCVIERRSDSMATPNIEKINYLRKNITFCIYCQEVFNTL